MANVYMRNKQSGEIRDVDPDSKEFHELQGQVTALGQSMWEQTSFAHAAAIKDRAKFGELKDEDLGTDDQDGIRFAALKLHAEGVGIEENPHLELSPGEIENGLTRESKLEDLKQQFHSAVAKIRGSVVGEASDRIADEREERPQAKANPAASARAGGSDDRTNAPAPGHGAPGGGGSGSSGTASDSDDGSDGSEAAGL